MLSWGSQFGEVIWEGRQYVPSQGGQLDALTSDNPAISCKDTGAIQFN